ncbi:hypothetical protein CR513_50894, partial [Mucuna pruriens]
MYQDLKKMLVWSSMKRDVANYVAACLLVKKLREVDSIVHQREVVCYMEYLQRSKIYVMFLAKLILDIGKEVVTQFSLSFTNKWSIQKDNSAIRRLVEGLCYGSSKELG